MISHGRSHYDYKITEDKTYEWVFRNMYQKVINHFVSDITKEIKRAMGKDNYLKGKFQEFLIKEKLKPEKIEERTFKKINLKSYEIDLLITAKNHPKQKSISTLKTKEINTESEMRADGEQSQQLSKMKNLNRYL